MKQRFARLMLAVVTSAFLVMPAMGYAAQKNPCAANPCAANPCAKNPCAANPCGVKKEKTAKKVKKSATNPCAANPCAANPCAKNPCATKK